MQGPTVKNAISLFFLASFVLLRVGNLHAAVHTLSGDDPKHCERCDLYAHSNQAVTLHMGPAPMAVPNGNLPTFDEINAVGPYSAPAIKTLHFDYCHNKPPPFSIRG